MGIYTKRLEILVDMDGILVNLLRKWLHEINQKFGLNVTVDHITEWDLAKSPALAEVSATDIYGMIHRPGFFQEAPEIPGAIDAMNWLNNNGHTVKVLTATPVEIDQQCREEKWNWLTARLPWLQWENVLFASAKEKLDVIGDVLIEDRPDTLVGYADRYPNSLVLGIEYPYNKDIVHIGHRNLWLCYDHNDTVKAWMTILTLIQDKARLRS